MYIYRHLEKKLDLWKENSNRRPLLIRGARQVGKSRLVKEWAKRNFSSENFLEINLEERPDLKPIFEKDLSVDRIINDIEFFSGKKIITGSFLLFIDEIQVCPSAIMALRYFFEKLPELHIVAAGSLIDFVLQQISYPVGRIDTLHLLPMNFFEFLAALGKEHYVNSLANHDLKKPLPAAVHNDLLAELKKYFRIGGMPEAVAEYAVSQSLPNVSTVQERLCIAYKSDFAKYSREADWDLLLKVFVKAPQLVGEVRVKYSRIDCEVRSYKLKKVISLLVTAGLLHPVYNTTAKKLPLGMEGNTDIFKLLFIDIGLMQFILGFDWSKFSADLDLTNIADGQLAEQFVGQELIAARSGASLYQTYYWYNTKKGADAEVDFIIEHQDENQKEIVPLEVKSGHRGTLKSLSEYQKIFKPKQLFILSQRHGENVDNLYWVPLYAACLV